MESADDCSIYSKIKGILNSLSVQLQQSFFMKKTATPSASNNAAGIPGLLRIAIGHHQAGRMADAEQAYRKVLAADPKNFSALHLLGILTHQTGHPEQAVELIRQAIKQDATNAVSHNSLGSALNVLKKWDEAAISFKKALALKPDFAEASFHLGGSLYAQGKLDEAVTSYQHAIALMPSYLEAHVNLGCIFREQRKLDLAIEQFRKVLALQSAYVEVQNDLGTMLHDLGRFDEAAACFQAALARKPDYIDAQYNLGNTLLVQNQIDQAIGCFKTVLAHNPTYAGASINLGNAYKSKGMLNEARDCFQFVLTQNPNYFEAHINLGNVLKDQKQLDAAADRYLLGLQIKPDYAEAHYNLGMVRAEQDRFAEAVACFQKALALKPTYPDALNNLGNALVKQEHIQEAVDYYQKALALKPDFVEAHNNLGNAYKEQGRMNEALQCFDQALALQPDCVESYNNLGIVLHAQGKLDKAIASYLQAIAIKPSSPEAYNNLGNIYKDQGKLDDALQCFLQTIKLKPDSAEAYNNLGNVSKDQGKLDDALAYFSKTLELKPGFVDAFSNWLYTALYSARFTPEELLTAHQRFAQQYEESLKKLWQPHQNTRDPLKRLKIGYVSADLRRHPVAYFIEPALQHHDKSQVEVFCYYNHTFYDDVTQRLKTYADNWIECKGMTDDVLAQRIHADGIDILIDLTGHSAGNRLRTFMRKPAPVQATYLGYPSTTGLTSIDYRITDNYLDPVGMTEQFNTEQLWRLPDVISCYRPRENSPDVIDHPPAVDNGYVTFGCFNNFTKVNDRVLAVWARILEKVPQSRLMLEISGLDGAQFRADVERRLQESGLSLDRMILVPRDTRNQYALYNRIDIALDPFPYNGGTTSFDTLWMGVPFIALAGTHGVARMGVSTLTNAGLAELVGQTEDEYCEVAAALALDMARLKNIRAGLRERSLASPLMDGPRFTRHMEQAYRAMWQRWCEAQSLAQPSNQ
jgi:protein O-GlcNAc transferase